MGIHSMDNTGVRRLCIDSRLASIGRRRIECGRGGDCLFHSLSHSINHENIRHTHHSTETHESIRKRCVMFLTQKREKYRDTICAHATCTHTPTAGVDAYLACMAKSGTWGDDLMIMAAAQIWNLNITVHSQQGEQYTVVRKVRKRRRKSNSSDIHTINSLSINHTDCPRRGRGDGNLPT